MAAVLKRALTRLDATSLVIGTVIGTGVFLKTAPMSQQLGSPAWVLLAWVAAGLLSLMGALVYAELGGLFPLAGGEFVYLQKSYGDKLGFLYGWQRFWIGSPGSIAAYAVGAATFASGAWALDPTQQKLTAVGLVIVFSALNCLNVEVGGKLQSFLTILKIFLVAGLSLAAFGFAKSGNWHHLSEKASAITFHWSAFGTAMIAALWAFDGWNNLPMAAGEVERPDKTLPLALIGGILVVLLVYALANLGYFYALPFSEIVGKSDWPVATRAAQTFLGKSGVGILSVAFVISAVGAMNGSILTGARVPYAMAVEGVFPKFIGKVSRTTHVPVTSVILQGLWACVLALSGTFDMLTDWVIFSSWIFYGLCGWGVLRLRKKHPELSRPYRVPFFPVLPVLFCVMSLVLLINTLWSLPRESGLGLLFILSGVPFYALFRRKKR
jgi:APA family basic amino acid/polyamine antiporter